MKKKLLVALLILTIAVSVILAFTLGVGAETAEPTLSIGGKTLVMENSIYIRYMVAADNVASINDVTLLVWNKAADINNKDAAIAKVKTTGKTTVNGSTGIKYYHFEFTGVAAKMLADDFYAAAYVKVGDKEYYSAAHKYSVLKYAYNTMGKLDKAASTTPNLIPLLEEMLDYGANAQKYFKYKTDRLASADFYQIKTVGGKLEDGFTDGLYLPGDLVTITADAPAEGYYFAGWQKASTGEIVSFDATATIEVGNEKDTYTALYEQVKTFTATFVDYDGSVIKTEVVEEGKGATAPANPEREGYRFTGWDKSLDNVTGDITFVAQYERVITAPTIFVDSADVSASDGTVSIKISLLNNPGISSLKLSVAYGSELELQSVTFDSAFGMYAISSDDISKNPQTLTVISPFADVTASGTFATLTFKIDEYIAVDTIANVTVTVVDSVTADYTPVEYDVVNGTVSIKAEGSGNIILPPDVIG